MKRSYLLAIMTAAIGCSTAHAATFSFTFTVSGVVRASGTLTTLDTVNALGGYNVTSISGVADGSPILGEIVDPYSPQDAYYNADGTVSSVFSPSVSPEVWQFDNVLYTPFSEKLDGRGLLFNTATDEYNLFIDGRGEIFGYTATGSTQKIEAVGKFAIAAATVPEPASWMTMIGGFGLIGSVMRRRRVAVGFG